MDDTKRTRKGGRPAGPFVALLAYTLATATVVAHQRAAAKPPSPSVEYLETVIRSLSRADSAMAPLAAKLKDPSAVERMTALKNAQIGLAMAAATVKPLDASKNERSREAVTHILESYWMLDNSLTLMLGVTEKLENVKSEDDLVPIRRDISDAKVLNQQATAQLLNATTLAFASWVVAAPKDPDHVALDMTAAEFDALSKTLSSAGFSRDLRAPDADDDTAPIAAAKTLAKAFGKPWRVAR